MCLTEGVIIKPLIICGGCSFTHSPDSWAQVLGRNTFDKQRLHNMLVPANEFFKKWKQFGIEIANADPTIFPDDVKEYWDEVEDLSTMIDVIVVAQGAAGNILNSRVIRNFIDHARIKWPNRPIKVFWQLSGWDRHEFVSNIHQSPYHDEILEKHFHQVSNIRPYDKLRDDLTHINGLDNAHIPPRKNDSENPHEINSNFNVNTRYFIKSGGSVAEQWVETGYGDYFTSYYTDVYNIEQSVINNLEAIEYTKLYCDSKNIDITIFPGWGFCWRRSLVLNEVTNNLYGLEILGRLSSDTISYIDGSYGIAEWGIRHRLYHAPDFEQLGWPTIHNKKLEMVSPGGSEVEKYFNGINDSQYKSATEGQWDSGNHPSVYTHARFADEWIIPQVKEFLEKVN